VLRAMVVNWHDTRVGVLTLIFRVTTTTRSVKQEPHGFKGNNDRNRLDKRVAVMQVKVFSEKAGVAPHIVRYYTRIGLLAPSRNPQNGYYQFGQDDLVRIKFIRVAQAVGFRLSAVGDLIRDEMRGGAECCVRTQSTLLCLVEDARAEIVSLQSRLLKMEYLLADWGDTRGCGNIQNCICPQIECVIEPIDE